jgi:hypothetical protein
MIKNTAKSLVKAKSMKYIVKAVRRLPRIIINEVLFAGSIRLKKTISANSSGKINLNVRKIRVIGRIDIE